MENKIDINYYVEMYLNEKIKILNDYPIQKVVDATELVFKTYENGNTIFAMANGGNAGTVDHLYCDFKHHPFVSEDKSKSLGANIKRLDFVNLCSSPSEITGLVNDFGVEEMYSNALLPLVRENDLVMGFSGSGNSKNIINAFKVAKDKKAHTLSISKGNGGIASEIVDVSIVIPGNSNFPGQTGANDNNFHFEDEVLSINSMIVGLLKLKVSNEFK